MRRTLWIFTFSFVVMRSLQAAEPALGETDLVALSKKEFPDIVYRMLVPPGSERPDLDMALVQARFNAMERGLILQLAQTLETEFAQYKERYPGLSPQQHTTAYLLSLYGPFFAPPRKCSPARLAILYTQVADYPRYFEPIQIAGKLIRKHEKTGPMLRTWGRILYCVVQSGAVKASDTHIEDRLRTFLTSTGVDVQNGFPYRALLFAVDGIATKTYVDFRESLQGILAYYAADLAHLGYLFSRKEIERREKTYAAYHQDPFLQQVDLLEKLATFIEASPVDANNLYVQMALRRL